MAYDSQRQRVVLFGGTTSAGASAETWEWDGSTWYQLAPPTAPPAFTGAAMVFDSARGRTVLCGTQHLGASTGPMALWEWDGVGWQKKLSAVAPSRRVLHAMVFDSRRGVVVLFGGSGPTFYMGDTWEWDGTAWVERFPAQAPAGRHAHEMVFDETRGKTILFGGQVSGVIVSDTWEWDGSTWTQAAPASSPPARQTRAMAYDTLRQRVVVFGGTGTLQVFTDTWEWDGTLWVQRFVNGPSGRGEALMVFDSTMRRSVLFGGRDINNVLLGDT